jgi:hypothetical protein
MVDALMALGVSGDPEDGLFNAELNAEQSVFSDPLPTRDAAHQLIDKALTIVDPEHLVVDPTSEYPPEIVAAAQVALDRVFRYADEQPFGD